MRNHIGENYPQNPKWSTKDGHIIDSLENYFPRVVKRDTTTIYHPLEYGFTDRLFSTGHHAALLFAAKEPVLWNYYLGHDICRFLCVGSFDAPFIISIHKDAKKVWLNTKRLSGMAEFELHAFYKPPGKDKIGNRSDTNWLVASYFQDSILIERPWGKQVLKPTKTILDLTKQLTANEWSKFLSLLDDAGFWNLEPHQPVNDGGLDGEMWYIEAQLENRYWVAQRWSPKGSFRKCGEYLIDLSGVNEKVY